MSLRTRLFVGFLAVIALTLGVVGVALLALLANSPLIDRQDLTRLNEVARGLTRQPPPAANLQAYVEELAALYEVRVLVLRPPNQTLADSQPDLPELRLNLRLAGNLELLAEGRAGRAHDAAGAPWLYVARAFLPGRLIVVAALPQPRFPLLAFFGDNLLWPLLQAGALAVLAALGLSWWLARSIASPLQQMAGVAQNIARGRYDQTAPTAGPTEVAALGQAMNQMAAQVQATQTAQREFLANVSHELKTPLTAIQGFAHALADDVADTPDQRARALTIIQTEAERMRRLVAELLELTRLESALKTLTKTPLALAPLLADLHEKFTARAQAGQVTLQVSAPPALSVPADRDRLTQVLNNLLDNALKHTPPGGTVRLSAAPVGSQVEITVQDTGPGIPPADLPHIFERFYQVDKARTHSGSVGLGLAISREIVHAHGGTLTAENAPAGGACFRVRLPG